MILIVYGSKYGGTSLCVEALSQRFIDDEVHIRNLDEKDIDLKAYDTIIIGGPVFAGRLYQPITDFCLKHKPVLLEKKLGLFICGCAPDKFDEDQIKKAYDTQLQDHALVKVKLGFVVDPSKLNLFTRFIMKKITGKSGYQKEINNEAIEKIYQTITQ